ncbi:glycosyltransferase family 2 protein [Hymenobacter sp. NBH84]|uniref:glycosyltransferase n=1 Tax=Hymenobacter sp. NBH84 TaxID=2596915 RepID=UPI0016244241|nr:glycosyltransferase [Hymenobacter sp. NBH84]QNE38267.1 glycosyltransferase family 2 protein [Hymenobacter sp. NBH84]
MSIVTSLISILLQLVGAYLLLNVLYLLFFALAGHRSSPAVPSSGGSKRRMCVLLPAYRADTIIAETAPAARKHAYAGVADVCVIADGLQLATVQTLRAQQINVVEVFFEKSTKGKALFSALTELPAGAYDVAVILDVDNVMAPGFLTQVDAAFAAGYRVVQGHRTAKNLDSPFAVLDACNEEINNHIFRRGHANLGMSSSLIGSGMAFDYEYLKQLLQDIGDTPGEDKELDFSVLRDKKKIAYLPSAYVYDEKIPNAKVFATQRTRWLATQQEFLVKYFGEGLRQLRQGNIDFVDKILQSMLLPRVLLLGILGFLLMLSLLWRVGPGPDFWLMLLLGTALALLLALPKRLYTRQVGRAVLHLPVALSAMVLALLQIRKAKTSFMPTPHVARQVDSAASSSLK